MRHCRLTLAALTALSLPAAPALAVQDPPAARTERIENFAELETFSAPGLVAELIHIGELAQGQISWDDPDGLIDQLQAGEDRLAALSAVDGGRSGLSFEINFTTDLSTPVACENSSPVAMVSRQGIEIAGTVCRIVTQVGDAPVLMFDQLLQAPIDGQPIYIHIITSMIAQSDGLRDAGGEILSQMATDVLSSLILGAPADTGGDLARWRAMLQALTDQAQGFIRFDAPDALAEWLLAAYTGVEAEAGLEAANWGLSFGLEAGQSIAHDGVFDPDRLAAAARPPRAAWCLPDRPFTSSSPLGVARTWQQCWGTPPGEDPETATLRKIWFEETTPTAYRWLEFTVVGTTDTAAELPRLEALCQELLATLTHGLILASDEPRGTTE